MRNHRGFTLIEIMIAVLIMVVVSGAIFKLLTTNQRLSRAQAANVDLQANERAAAVLVPTELRELNTVIGGTVDQNDILDVTLQPTAIRYRSMRGLGFVCQATTTEIRLLRSSWYGYRLPQIPRDAALVFVQTDPSTGSDGSWVPKTITAVSANTCPGVGNPAAITLTITPALAAAPEAGIPVRIWEDMQMGLYVQDGKSWLGARSWSAGELGYQPLLGPLQAADGFRLRYYFDDPLVETAVKQNVRSIKVTIKGVTSDRVSTSGGSSVMGYVQDSVVSQVTLRNALR
jgi:prepilin-type N-terminal cleavage/methylation domain-containing protein